MTERLQKLAITYVTTQTNLSLRTALGNTAEILSIHCSKGAGEDCSILDATGGSVVTQLGVTRGVTDVVYAVPIPVSSTATGLWLTTTSNAKVGILYQVRNAT